MEGSNDMAVVRRMVLEQMADMRKVDGSNEDLVRSMSVKTQMVVSCAKVYSECCSAESNMIKARVAATKVIGKTKKQKMLAAPNEA